MAFDKPTPAQCVGVPSFLNDSVVLVDGRGTGKATALCIAAAQIVDDSLEGVQVLLIAPSRVAAARLHRRLSLLLYGTRTTSLLLSGGTDTRADTRGPPAHIVIGCPNRIADMVARRLLLTDAVKLVGITGGDVLLRLGFGEELELLINTQTPEAALVAVTAHTTTPELLSAVPYATVLDLSPPGKPSLIPNGMRLYRLSVPTPAHKLLALIDLYETLTIQQAVVFCSTRRRVDDVVSGLQAQDITVSCLRDDMEGPDLEHALQQFRKGHTRVLVTSDVLCEGIEAVAGDRVPIIVHVDVPGERATFVQRLWTFGGGLATSLRRSVCLLSEGEAEVGRALERMLGVEFIESPEAPAALL